MPQSLAYCRALSANKENISDFFGKLGAIYGKLNEISKPMHIDTFKLVKINYLIIILHVHFFHYTGKLDGVNTVWTDGLGLNQIETIYNTHVCSHLFPPPHV